MHVTGRSLVTGVLLCALLALACSTNATTYYVNGATGDDNGPGSRELPWRSIDRGDALSRLLPGDTVMVAGGVYVPATNLGVTFRYCSGTAGAPITYKAAGRVLIDESGMATPDSYAMGFTFYSVSYVVLDGFETTGCEWGVYYNGDTNHHNVVTNCTFHDSRYTGSGDHGGMYIADADDNLIDHCVFYNIPGGIGIHSDISAGLRVYNNTVIGGKTGIDLHHGGSADVKNNILTNLTQQALLFGTEAPLTATNDYNLFYQNAANYAGSASAGTHEIIANPTFAKAACRDYRLHGSSPAIDKGTALLWGYEDQGPDIGAYEYQPTIQIESIGDLKSPQPGQPIDFTSQKVVTAATGTFTDFSIYIEEPTRSGGVKVICGPAMPAVSVGDRITFTGSVGVDINEEPVVNAICLTSQTPGSALTPMGITGKSFAGPVGVDPTGLLARIWGKVSFIAPDRRFVFVDDGSGLVDSVGRAGVKVELAGTADPFSTAIAPGQFLSVTGLAGMGASGSGNARVMRPRSDADIKAEAITVPDSAIARNWVASHLSQASWGQPFSFIYNGVPSQSMLDNWQKTYSQVSLDAERTERTTTYLDPATGLQVRCVSIEYLDVPAVEWTVYLKNTGAANSPIIQDIRSLNANFSPSSAGDSTLYYADGSDAAITDFQPRQQSIGTSSVFTLAPNGGRSSNGVLPFFNLAKPDGSGVVLAVGWTGQWSTSFARGTTSSVNVQSGVQLTHLTLYPGEEIRTPSSLLVFWSGGDRMRGQNYLRKLILEHFAPRPGGVLVDPPISGISCIDFTNINQSNQVTAINNVGIHNLPVDSWWMDAGWYPCNGAWWNTGTWDPDLARFPNGLKPIADACHANDLRYILWFEPERAVPGSWLVNNHPEWFYNGAGGGLLNLGNPDALAWLKSKISGMISSIGIDCYRQDFNMDPLATWRASDAADRQGMSEIKHIMALYEYWDYLLATNPNIFIDNCSSGGRRLDIEMARRSIPLLRTDYSSLVSGFTYDGFQCHEYGLAQWLPMHGSWCSSPSAYEFRSGMGTNMYVAMNLYDVPIPENGCSGPNEWATWTNLINTYRGVKHYYLGDFYPLTPYSTATNVWIAWQFDRPDLGEGMVQAFRRVDNTTATMNFKLKGLMSGSVYRITNVDTGTSYVATGSSLMGSGMNITLSSRPTAAIVKYKRMN